MSFNLASSILANEGMIGGNPSTTNALDSRMDCSMYASASSDVRVPARDSRPASPGPTRLSAPVEWQPEQVSLTNSVSPTAGFPALTDASGVGVGGRGEPLVLSIGAAAVGWNSIGS